MAKSLESFGPAKIGSIGEVKSAGESNGTADQIALDINATEIPINAVAIREPFHKPIAARGVTTRPLRAIRPVRPIVDVPNR